MLADITTIRNFVAGANCPFHCMVIDPPWENASARRSGHYATLPSRYLLSIPMKRLVDQEEGLVVLWMTNRSRLWRFMETELLPAWGLRLCATWLWLKVTSTDHRPVTPLDASHRRPYEVMLLLVPQGRQVPAHLQPPDKFVVASTPGEHSRKPHLSTLLAPYLPAQPKCAELFARQLWPGWTSWGNDVLHFQRMKYFTLPPEDPDAAQTTEAST
ncbi:hypothetical protein WJX73_001282 [Symbiochloris irregularis]|uniref:Uncharacterized protein n=1 Tax=Symbiochloris irregularis TaxID=706552 RepID=A0AAW1NUV7_9CHLO